MLLVIYYCTVIAHLNVFVSTAVPQSDGKGTIMFQSSRLNSLTDDGSKTSDFLLFLFSAVLLCTVFINGFRPVNENDL